MPKYAEGDWFAVPLRTGGFAVGIVARANPRSALLGYFFGPRRNEVPTMEDVERLAPSSAALICKFGHLGLRDGKWPIIGRAAAWDRQAWPTPTFARYEELSGRTYEVTYADDDPNRVIAERLITREAAQTLPEDGLAGAGFVEIRLTDLLG
jgi:hypothetical protein